MQEVRTDHLKIPSLFKLQWQARNWKSSVLCTSFLYFKSNKRNILKMQEFHLNILKCMYFQIKIFYGLWLKRNFSIFFKHSANKSSETVRFKNISQEPGYIDNFCNFSSMRLRNANWWFNCLKSPKTNVCKFMYIFNHFFSRIKMYMNV